MTDHSSTEPAEQTEAPHAAAAAGGRVTRRSFLVGAGVVAGAAVAIGAGVEVLGSGSSGTSGSSGAGAVASIEHGVLDGLVSPHIPRLSLGYVADSAAISSLSALFGGGRQLDVSPASQLRIGSPQLYGRAVSLTVLGVTPGALEVLAKQGQAVLLDALVAAPSGPRGATVPFFAWSFRPQPVPASSNPAAFRVAAAHSHRVGLRLQLRPGAAWHHGSTASSAGAQAAAAGSATQILTSGFGSGLAKLRSGVYLVGIDHDEWNQSHRLATSDTGAWSSRPSVVLTVGAATD